MPAKRARKILTLMGSESNLRLQEIISGQYEKFQSSRFIEPHRRSFYSFFLVKTGYIKHSIDFRTYTCRAGELFFMAPEQVYLIDSAADFGGISVNCNSEWLTSEEIMLPIIQNADLANNLSPGMETLGDISGLAEKMLLLYRDKDPLSEKLLRSLFSSFLIYLSRAYIHQHRNASGNPQENLTVVRFRLLINKHWKSFSHLSDYAKVLCISAGHLNAVVRENTGRKATEWIQEKKLMEAKRLLLHSEGSIKEIAFETGFEDPAYFNRFFKKWNGSTPLRFRDQIRKKYNNNLK